MKLYGKRARIILIITSILAIFIASFTIFLALRGGHYSFWGLIKDNREIQSQKFDAYVDNDGVMDVDEKILYNLNNKNGVIRNYAYDISEYQRIEIEQVIVNGTKKLNKVKSAKVGSRGVFTFKDTRKKQELKIFQPTNGHLKVDIKYRAYGLITEDEDMQDLYWMFYDSRGGSIAPLNMNVKIHFPEAVGKENMKLFGHGNLDGKLTVVNNKTVEVNIPKFNPNTFGEVRVLLPTKPLSNITPKIEITDYKSALKNEIAQAKETNKQVVESAKVAERQRLIPLILAILAALITIISIIESIIFFRKIYNKYDKEKYDIQLEYFREIPTKYSPAASWLVAYPDKEMISEKQLTAALFNLYVKKRISIRLQEESVEKETKEKIFITILPQKKEQLPANEQYIYDWLKDIYDEGVEGPYEEFIGKARLSKVEARLFIQNYSAFSGLVKSEYESLSYREKPNGKEKEKIKPILILLLCVMFIVCMLKAISADSAFLFFPIAILTIMIYVQVGAGKAYKNNCFRYTEEGAAEHARILGLKKYLEDYSLLNEALPSSVNIWEKYFVFGLALGVTEKTLDILCRKLPMTNTTDINTATTIGTLYTMNRLNAFHHLSEINGHMVSRASSVSGLTRSGGSSGGIGASFGGGGGFSGGGGFGGGGGGSSSF